MMTKTLEQRVTRIEEFLTEAQPNSNFLDDLLVRSNLHDTITNLVKSRFYVESTSTLEDRENEGYG
jgi:hypothetical protein